MSESFPNVLLLMSDQHRADCLGARGHAVLNTPHLDALAASGTHFLNAYSATGLCAPARRTLHTGQKPSHHGVLDADFRRPLEASTLAQLLSAAGFVTHLVGKLHLWPHREYYGFHTADWADWVDAREEDDYSRFVKQSVGQRRWVHGSHGFNQNSRKVCTWALPAELHSTDWCCDSAIRFLRSRPPQQPFFLMVSFIAPHPPLFPLPHLLDKYLAKKPVQPTYGNWSTPLAEPGADALPLAWRGRLDPRAMHLFRSAYYASIEHVDDRIGRILKEIPENTLVIYVSDHGDMLGDHYLFRKRGPYQASVHVPLIVRSPASRLQNTPRTVSTAVELMDIAPTILDFMGTSPPATMDGMSLLPLLRGEAFSRSYVHGENPNLPPLGSGMQFVTNGQWKYVWYDEYGWEQLFNLEADPSEINELSADPEHSEVLGWHRQLLIRQLTGRREGFTDGVRLLPRSSSTTAFGVVPSSVALQARRVGSQRRCSSIYQGPAASG